MGEQLTVIQCLEVFGGIGTSEKNRQAADQLKVLFRLWSAGTD